MAKCKTAVVKYRAQGARHGAETLIVGAIGLIVIMLVNLLRPGTITIVEIFLLSACLGATMIGFFKTQEPYYSLLLTAKQLTYQHKYGSWQLSHTNFKYSGVPKIVAGFEVIELNAVGIKVNDMDEFLAALAPRIAGKLLIEQRNLFMQLVKAHCKSGDCPSEWLVEDNHYHSQQGINYSGLIAMFANRCKHLKLLTGYDLLLPASVLDRDIWGMSSNLNNWKRNPCEFITSQQ
jgi:hypothetical protein